IDSLDDLHRPAARKALSAARDIPEGGSLTVIAASSEPVGGETTVIALDPALTSTGRFPAVDLVASGTLPPGLPVGDAGADELGPAVVDVLAESGGGILDLAVDGEVHEVLQLRVLEAAADEAQLDGGLLAALGEVPLVEREAQLAVLEDEVLT